MHALNQYQLSHTLFPIGEFDKAEIRKLAKSHGLSTHDKKDSTGICFIGERRFKDFLQQYLPANPGAIETTDGEQLGRHAGLMYYTYGQRQGLGIGGRHNHAEAPWYVVHKDLPRNVLVVAQGNENNHLLSQHLIASNPAWINAIPPRLPLHCMAKIRYRQRDQRCTVSRGEGQRLEVSFDVRQRAVTPGQEVVFYQQERCLGGASIERYVR